MSELGEATLQVSYRGAEITEQMLEKLFAATLREIENAWARETEKTKADSIIKDNAKPLGKEVHTPAIARAAKDLRGEGVLFQVLKQPGQETAYTLVFKGKDLSTIEKALKSMDGGRTLEKTPERAEPGQSLAEYAIAAEAREKAALLDNNGEPNLFDRLQPKAQEQGKPRIFTGKDLQDDIRIAREAVTKRNAERAATRAPKAPDRGRDR